MSLGTWLTSLSFPLLKINYVTARFTEPRMFLASPLGLHTCKCVSAGVRHGFQRLKSGVTDRQGPKKRNKEMAYQQTGAQTLTFGNNQTNTGILYQPENAYVFPCLTSCIFFFSLSPSLSRLSFKVTDYGLGYQGSIPGRKPPRPARL